MGNRCEDIKCPYHAADGSCLLPEEELAEKCPARETLKHEEKDSWMLNRKRKSKTKGGVQTTSLENP